MARSTILYECVETISGSAAWAFAKWEPPPAAAYGPLSRTAARARRGTPCWWRTTFVAPEAEQPLRIDTAGLSKGQVFVNGHNLGRYFTSTADGHAVGPQRRLYMPGSWIKPGEPNELTLFDEHGFAPHRVQIVYGDEDE